MSSINEIAQSASVVKTPATLVIDTASTSPAVSSGPSVAEQAQQARQDSAATGNQIPPTDTTEKDATKEEQVLQTVQELKKYAQSVERDLKFNVDDESGRLVITVIDPETDKVVRQIPPEETLHILRSLEKGGGALFDNKV